MLNGMETTLGLGNFLCSWESKVLNETYQPENKRINNLVCTFTSKKKDQGQIETKHLGQNKLHLKK